VTRPDTVPADRREPGGGPGGTARTGPVAEVDLSDAVRRLAGYDGTVEADDPYCLRPGEAARLLAGHRWRRFVVIGDSVASGVGDPVPGYVNLPWADRIAAELASAAPGLTYANLGERELFAAQIRAGQLDAAVAFRPDLAMVCGGGNDALRRTYDPDAVDVELASMIEALSAAGADVITVGMFNVSYAPGFPDKVKHLVRARMGELADRTAALGRRLGTLHVDVSEHPGQYLPEMYSGDGVHGNLRSHAVCATAAVRRLGAHVGAR